MRQLLAFFLALTLPLLGADAQWEQLKKLRSGERIWIKYTQSGKLKSAKGEVAACTDDGMTVRLKGKDLALARADIRKVEVYGGKSRAKGAGIGALIGAPIGAAIYGAAVADDDTELFVSPAAIVVVGTLFIAGVGALIGLGVGATKKVTLYEAPAASVSK